MPVFNRSAIKPAPKRRRKSPYKPESVLAIFHRFITAELPDAGGNYRMYCPICEDPNTSKSPSAGIKPESGEWHCMSCDGGGAITDLVKDLQENSGFDTNKEMANGFLQNPEQRAKRLANLQSRAAGGPAANAQPLPSREQILQWTEDLLDNPPALQVLQSKRGITLETIRTWDIGWDGNRYMLPVYNAARDLINVRKYKPGALQPKDKMFNVTGHGTAAIFGVSRLRKHDTIVITEGEMDCILLNQHGIPAITQTAGAKYWNFEWNKLFTGKEVYVCYDNDKAGKEGSKKVQKMLAPFAASVSIVEIPLDTAGADVTDYLHVEGFSSKDFVKLMEDANAAADVKINKPLLLEGLKVSLGESMSEAMQNETLEMTVSVAGKQQEPYTAPKIVEANCDMSKGKVCDLCPVSAKNGSKIVEIRQDDEQLFRFLDSAEERRNKLMKEVTGARCSDRVEFTVSENYHVEELLVQPSIDDRQDGESQTPIKRTIFSVSTHKSNVNEKRRIVGKNVADPKTGKLKFMAWQSEPIDLDIDKFTLSDDDVISLKALYQPKEGQTPLEKSFEIANDLAQNVTHIYGRDYLHVAYDLVFHSVLSFKVHDFLVEKGWLEMAVIGDTRTGKSEIAKSLINHYRSGELKSCEGMSFAGVVGGVQQVDNRWHMSWGVVPMNDRRLVVLDEASELADKNVIEQMSSIRSSGVAQVTKIQTEQTSARTRLIWISNPADGGMLGDQPEMGMAALRTVVHNNEDIARFDFVTAAAKGEISDAVINSSFSEKHDPLYDSEMSEKLVKWVWSLTRDDVVVTKAAASAAITAARDLGSRYISDPPLIQSENVRFKVLRIAAALAARTFNIGKTGKLLVQKEHVEDAVKFLDHIYGMENMGYARKSRRAITAQKRAVERTEAATKYLRERRSSILHTLQGIGGKTFRQNDFVQMGGMSGDEANLAVRMLLDWKMVTRRSRGDITMSQELIGILRNFEDEDEDE